MNFEILLNSNVDSLTEEQIGFIETHKKIIHFGNEASKSLVLMSLNLKKMSEKDYYKCAGFETFADYAESAVGLKKSQAYNFVKLCDSYSPSFLEEHENVGVTKLLLLSKLGDEETVKEVIETVNVEDKTVSELNQLVDSLKKENKELKKEAKNNSKTLKDEIKRLKEELKVAKEVKEPESTLFTEQEEKVVQENEKVKELEMLLEAKEKELSELQKINKSNAINSNPGLLKFKIRFELIQNDINNLKEFVKTLTEEEQIKCNQALKALGGTLNG